MSNIPTSERRFLETFLIRTKSNLLNYDDEFDMTNTINCSLGLIVFPFEFNRGRIRKIIPRVLEMKASKLAREIGFRFSKFQPIEDVSNGLPLRYRESEKSVNLLLNKIRNGLAHQNIRPRNNNGFFDEIVIWNVYVKGRGPNRFSEKDVSVIFNQTQLRAFALSIVDSFLEELKK